jgi:PLP dependent protein
MRPVDEPALTADLLGDRLERLHLRVREAAERAGRDPHEIRIVAVTKGFGVEVARLAGDVGLRSLGENRVQEALPKLVALPDLEWHLVGHLQSNKARTAVRAFEWIQAVDSVALLRRIEGIAHDEGRRPRLLLELNVSAEASKYGFEPGWFVSQVAAGGDLVEAVKEQRHASVQGLMTIGPMGASVEEARAAFGRCRVHKGILEQRIGQPLPELSMGMSADYEAAIAEGATMIRIGTALFGPRPGG